MTKRPWSSKTSTSRAFWLAVLSTGALALGCGDGNEIGAGPVGSSSGVPTGPGTIPAGPGSSGPIAGPGTQPTTSSTVPGVLPSVPTPDATGTGQPPGPVVPDPAPPSDTCVGTAITTQKRLVRLTDNQLVNTYAELFGEAALDMFAGEEILPAEQRAFPPLATIGTTIGQSAFDLRDRVAGRAMAHIRDNIATLTPCGAEPTDAACGLTAVLDFAQQAYRRPLNAEETASYETLWTKLTTDNAGSIAEAIQFGMDAVLLSPGFLYRTEMGGDWTTQGQLDGYELASQLSYFLTDGPPDAELMADAEAGMLVNRDTLRTHAERMLATDQARANLEAALIGYFQLTTVPGIVIDEQAVPGFEVTSGLKNSMYREAQEFIKNTLWGGSLGDLITSRRTWINNQIAPVYGVEVDSRDANVFTEVELPEGRSGLLTLAPFLISKSRPDGTSVVGRGLAVNAALVCSQNPPFPEGATELEEIIASQSEWTEKEKADFRADPANTSCSACHAQFDAMGLVLENYDAIGRHRTEDPRGNPIDEQWTTSTLPAAFSSDQNGDGVVEATVVATPTELAAALLRTDPASGTNALTRCMAMNFINFALADESQGSARATSSHPTNSCAVRAVTDAFEAKGEQSFSALVAEIVASDTLSLRSPGM